MCTELPPPGWELLLGWIGFQKKRGRREKSTLFWKAFHFVAGTVQPADGYPTPIGFREERGKKRKVKFFCHLMTKKCR